MLTLLVTAHRTNYLLEAITSVIAQTDKAFSLVFCADINHSPEVYSFFEKYRPYVQCENSRTIVVNGNGTAGFVRNAGFRTAETEWVCYLDGDDMLLPNAIETVNKEIRSTKSDIMSSGIIRINRDGSQTQWEDSLSYYAAKKIYYEDPDTVEEPTFFNHFQVIKKDLWAKYMYNEETNGEDIDFMLHQLLMGYYHKIPQYLYAYRNTPNSFAAEARFENCDICTIRYRDGYYERLFREKWDDRWVSNFKEGRKSDKDI